MPESKRPLPPMVQPFPQLVVSLLAIVGACTLAAMLIPQVSEAAAIRGGSIAAGSFLATQAGLRWTAARRQRSGRG